MFSLSFVTFGLVLTTVLADDNTRFKDDFFFGVATSAYQIEGGWNEDGKGENNWDRIVHTNPKYIAAGGNGDVACDSYHKWEEDVKLLVDLGVSHYRFSISWSRILPDGTTKLINQAGVNYYKNLIKELKKNSIEPFVTLFHWDTPQPLEDVGGWRNISIVDRYADYARTCFELFGDDVKNWMTFNEAKQTCTGGYGDGSCAPGIRSPGEGEYLCIPNILRSHAAAWHIYDKEFREKQKGRVGIVIDSNWWEPGNPDTDVEASDQMMHFTYGMYANPIFKGDFPQVVKETVARRSAAQGYAKSRLPEFTEEEIQTIKGTIDFLGLNQYSTYYVAKTPNPHPDWKGYPGDTEIDSWLDPKWPRGASPWLIEVPWGVRKILNWIKNTYGEIPIIVTENGWSDWDGTLDDQPRIDYIQSYLSNIKKAIDEDGINVFGYTVWSLVDNLEWTGGFTQKFGLYNVNFNDPNRTRTPKKSVEYYKNLIKTRCLGTCN